jgi:chemotaxis protein MotB
MSKAPAPAVIFVNKKSRRKHGAHHGGAWKVAYADFVTAMMAFFLVMWLITQSKDTKAAVAGYFRDPGAFKEMASKGILPGGALSLTPKVTMTGAEADAAAAEKERIKLLQTADHIREDLMKVPEDCASNWSNARGRASSTAGARCCGARANGSWPSSPGN